VPKESAVISGQKNDEAIALSKDHVDLVKFASKDDPDFIKVYTALVLELRKSFKPINDRWTQWKRDLSAFGLSVY
jgi:hypothetical protein